MGPKKSLVVCLFVVVVFVGTMEYSIIVDCRKIQSSASDASFLPLGGDITSFFFGQCKAVKLLFFVVVFKPLIGLNPPKCIQIFQL